MTEESFYREDNSSKTKTTTGGMKEKTTEGDKDGKNDAKNSKKDVKQKRDDVFDYYGDVQQLSWGSNTPTPTTPPTPTPPPSVTSSNGGNSIIQPIIIQSGGQGAHEAMMSSGEAPVKKLACEGDHDKVETQCNKRPVEESKNQDHEKHPKTLVGSVSSWQQPLSTFWLLAQLACFFFVLMGCLLVVKDYDNIPKAVAARDPSSSTYAAMQHVKLVSTFSDHLDSLLKSHMNELFPGPASAEQTQKKEQLQKLVSGIRLEVNEVIRDLDKIAKANATAITHLNRAIYYSSLGKFTHLPVRLVSLSLEASCSVLQQDGDKMGALSYQARQEAGQGGHLWMARVHGRDIKDILSFQLYGEIASGFLCEESHYYLPPLKNKVISREVADAIGRAVHDLTGTANTGQKLMHNYTNDLSHERNSFLAVSNFEVGCNL